MLVIPPSTSRKHVKVNISKVRVEDINLEHRSEKEEERRKVVH